jgi:LCP family protein required for cell wall assembly
MGSLVETEMPPLEGSSRSPMISVLLSLVWPGLGHLYLGRRLTAALFALPILALAVWAVVELSQGALGVAGDLLVDSFAFTLTVVILLAGLWRGVSMVHAMMVARPVRRWRLRYGALLGVLLIVVTAVHVRAAQYPWSFYNFDRAVVADDEPTPTPIPEGTGTVGPSASPTASPTAEVTFGPVQPVDTVGPTPSPTPTPMPTPVPTYPPNPHRITFLVTGIDYMQGRAHHSMDTLMVVSLETKTRKVTIISVPRDTANFDYYWGGQAGLTVKINTFYSRVKSGQIKAPDAPLAALKKEIGFLVGIPVDYYASIDIDGFPGLVDLVGGVDVINPKPIHDPFSHTELPAGPIHLDGITALHYVRSRHGAGDTDYTRSARQQDVIVALERKVTSPEMVLKLPELLDAAGKVIQTDFPLKNAKGYLKVTSNLPAGNISKCVLGPPYNYHPDSKTTSGSWTSRLKMDRVANLSVFYFGKESRFFGQDGVVPAKCQRP